MPQIVEKFCNLCKQLAAILNSGASIKNQQLKRNKKWGEGKTFQIFWDSK
jgi:hypothetical protein